MLTTLLIVALAGVTTAVPKPQGVEIPAAVLTADPVLFTAPLVVASDVPQEVAPAPIEPITDPSSVSKREATLGKRDGTCASQPAGSGPTSTPDTVAAFSANPDIQALSANASTPDGYVQVFQGATGSLSASNYMGLYTLDKYDTLTCASRCDRASGCQAFNLYSERDPSVDPNAVNCPNPPSTTNFKCTLWGAPVSSAETTNQGQWRDSFQVVIAGSNGYNKDSPPPPIDGFNGPRELGGAINAPLDQNGHNTYMGYKFFPFSQSQGYDTADCAQACNVQSAYNSRHPNADGSYQTCVFFNAYVLSKNAVPQGLYCSLYNQTWGTEYATNYGQYRGSDRYTVSRSYCYGLKRNGTTTTSSSSAMSSTSSSSVVSSPSVISSTSSPSVISSTSSSSVISSTSSSSVISSTSSSSVVSSVTSTQASTSSVSSTSPSTSSSTSSSTTNYPPGCTPTPLNLVQNGGFECGGLSSWTATDVSNTFHTITIGDNSDSAFEFLQEGAVSSDASMNPASLSQQLSGLVVGASYTVSFSVYFDKCTQSEGFVGVRFPNYSGGFTFDSCDQGQAAVGKYADASFGFTAEATAEQLRFEFVVQEPNAVIRLDNIAVTRA